jgi:hypothetical protein
MCSLLATSKRPASPPRGIVYDCVNMGLPPIGSTWLDRDPREKRTVKVIRYDAAKQRVRIHCIQTDVLSWAKPERFSGKSGGYARIDGGPGSGK